MIDFILANTGQGSRVTQADLAKQFGVGRAWVSCIINSDAFQVRLAQRKTEIVDPLIRGEIDEAIKGLVSTSIEILRQQLEAKPTFDNAMEVFKAAGRNLGLGQKSNVTVQMGDNSLINVLSGMGQGGRSEKNITQANVIENGSDSPEAE